MQYETIVDLKAVQPDGIKPEIISRWVEKFKIPGDTRRDSEFRLTELQQKVASDPETFGERGPNLIIAGPTSAGKTFAAEMLIANHLTRGKSTGCIYAVPLRALATEKYERFRQIFGQAGVYVSSSDYQEWDPFILWQPFRIAVVVYEKLYSWLTDNLNAGRILMKTDLLIVDELQMLTEPQRGAKLELILTFVRDRQRSQATYEDKTKHYAYRIIGLGPGGRALEKVAEWLEATTISVPDSARPVPLIEGYMQLDGHYELEFPEKLSPEAITLPHVHGKNRDELTQNFIVDLLTDREGTRLRVGGGKRVLVYCATKRDAEAMAQNIKKALGRRQDLSQELERRMQGLERTPTIDILRDTIPAGVGFHHGDLTFTERTLIEELFKEANALDVVTCTPTLAMGVNLPADYMLFPTIDTFRQNQWEFQGLPPQPLTVLEYKNFAGRAGRYILRDPRTQYGVALFLTDKSKEAADKELVEGLIKRPIAPIDPALHRWPYGVEPLALAVLAWQEANSNPRTQQITPGRIKEIYTHTFAGFRGVKMTPPAPDDLSGEEENFISDASKGWIPMQNVAVQALINLSKKHDELLEYDENEKSLFLNRAGKVVAKEGIHILTYEILAGLAKSLPTALESPLVMLEKLVQAPEVAKLYPTRPLNDTTAARLRGQLRGFFEKQQEQGQELGPIATKLLETTHVFGDKKLSYLMRTVAAWYWMSGESAKFISESPLLPEVRYGAVASLTDQIAWFLGALPALWNALGRPKLEELQQHTDVDMEECARSLVWDIKRFELRLRYGVPAGLESVAHLRVGGWHRERLVALWKKERWEHPVYLLGRQFADGDEEMRQLFRRLQDRIRKRNWADDPRSIMAKQISIVNEVLDTDKQRTLDQHQLLDPGWDHFIRSIYFAHEARLIQTIYEILQKKPLQMQVEMNAQVNNGADIFITLSGGYHIGVVVLRAGERGKQTGTGPLQAEDRELDWNDVFIGTNRLGPNGKTLQHVICISEHKIAPMKDKIRGLDRSILLLSREAFAQLCTRAVEGHQETESTDPTGRREPAIKQVRKVLEGLSAVLTTAAEVEDELNREGVERRISGQLVGRGGVRFEGQSTNVAALSVSDAPSNQTDSQRPGLFESQFTIIRDELEQLPQESKMERRIVIPLRESANALLSAPEQTSEKCIVTLKIIIDVVYYEFFSRYGQAEDYRGKISQLLESKKLPQYIATEAFSVLEFEERIITHAPATAGEDSTASSVTREDGFSILDSILIVAKWYLLKS